MKMYIALSLLCSVSFHHAQPGGPQDGLPGAAPNDDHDHQQLHPGGPQDGLPGAAPDDNHDHQQHQPRGPQDGLPGPDADQSYRHSSMWAMDPDRSALLDENELS